MKTAVALRHVHVEDLGTAAWAKSVRKQLPATAHAVMTPRLDGLEPIAVEDVP